MAHRPCLLSVHGPSATAGMTSLYDHLRPILGCTQQAGQSYLNSDGEGTTIAHEGRPQGGEGTHKGHPYRLSSRGILPWGGHPQGAPLPIVFSRRLPLGRAPTRGAPTDCLLAALPLGRAPTRGAPTDCLSRGPFARGVGRAPTRGAPTDCFLAALPLGRAPTRGAPTDCLLAALTLGRAPTRGAPTDCLLAALPLGLLAAFGPGIVFSRRFALGRAPTRGFAPTKGGAPTRFRQPHEPLRFSNLMQLPRPSRGARWTPGIR